MYLDYALAVDHVLTREERTRFLAVVFEENPALDGAEVADVLGILSDYYCHLAVVEPMYESYGGRVPELGLLEACTHLVLYLNGGMEPTWPQVLSIIDRVRRTT